MNLHLYCNNSISLSACCGKTPFVCCWLQWWCMDNTRQMDRWGDWRGLHTGRQTITGWFSKLYILCSHEVLMGVARPVGHAPEWSHSTRKTRERETGEKRRGKHRSKREKGRVDFRSPHGDKVREVRLRWFGQVWRRDDGYIGRRMLKLELSSRMNKGRRFMNVVREDMQVTGTTQENAADRKRWTWNITQLLQMWTHNASQQ